jgi:hypothetical protein
MKNRILPSCFLAFILGFSLLLFQHGAIASPPENGSATGPLNLNWVSLGPDNISGCTRAVLFDSRDANGNTIYAAGVSGGIYKSVNLGLTWNPMSASNNEVLKVTCMVQASDGTIYAGTGEDFCVPKYSGLQDYNYSTSFVGNGLWSSQDGINFTPVPGTQPPTFSTTSDWAFVNKLAISPNNGRLFAATNTGLKYMDQGGSWNTAMAGYTRDIKIAGDGTLYTQVGDSCYMANGGNLSNFINLSTGTTTGLPKFDLGRSEFAIAPSDENIVYASVTAKSSGYLINVYVSEDKGLTWSIILPGNNSFDIYEGQGCYSSVVAVLPDDPTQVLVGGKNMWLGRKVQASGFYSWEQITFGDFFALSPLYVPLSHHCYVFRPNDNGTILIASDGGVTVGSWNKGFETRNKVYETSQLYSVGFSCEKDVVIGGAQNRGTLLINGLLNSPKAAEQIWLTNGMANEGGSGGNAAISLIDPSYLFYTKNKESANEITLRLSIDNGLTYSLKFPTTAGSPPAITNSLNFTMPFTLWESFNFANSRDSVTYYANLKPVPADSSVVFYSENAEFPFYYKVPQAIPLGDSLKIQDPIQSRFVAFFTKSSKTGLYMTKDALQFTKDPEWFQIASIEDPVTCITISKDMNYLFAGTKTGQVYRVSNLALAYNKATADISSLTCIVASELVKTFGDGSRAVSSISFSPQDNNRAVFTLAGYGYEDYVYMTSNALDSVPTFENVQGNLPKIPVYSSLIEMDNKDKVLLGTDYGIFTTDNVASASWGADNSGLGTVPVFMLKQQTTYHPKVFIDDNGKIFNYPGVQNLGAIYAATFGRGLFIDTTYIVVGVDPHTVTGQTAGNVSIFPNPVRDEAFVSCMLSSRGEVILNLMDINGKILQTLGEGSVATGEYKVKLDMTGYPAGTYLVQVKSNSGIAFGKLVKVN